MVKRRLKRVLATVIVMTMVAGMNLTVFAEEGGSNANNSTGTVSGNAVEKEEPKKDDDTVAKTPIPQTGINSMITLILVATIISSILYIKYKKYEIKK